MKGLSSDLDCLISSVEVMCFRLSECHLSPGWRMAFEASNVPVIHYITSGVARITVGEELPVNVMSQTLVILPPGRPCRIEIAPASPSETGGFLKTMPIRWDDPGIQLLPKIVAGEQLPRLVSISGRFRATYGTSLDLFGALPNAIFERFEALDQVDEKLKAALSELSGQQVGCAAMATSLLKQVIIAVLRRSSATTDRWGREFSILKDPRIAKAFSEMVTKPGASHSVQTLSHTSGLSRSVFMSRFTEAFGNSPMMILRELRMRRARRLLDINILTIDQVAKAVGYASRSSFYRAFRTVYGKDLTV
jgi:AraC-like DNA-binding protein